MGARCCAGFLGALLGNVLCGAVCLRPGKEFGLRQVQGRASVVVRGWGARPARGAGELGLLSLQDEG